MRIYGENRQKRMRFTLTNSLLCSPHSTCCKYYRQPQNLFCVFRRPSGCFLHKQSVASVGRQHCVMKTSQPAETTSYIFFVMSSNIVIDALYSRGRLIKSVGGSVKSERESARSRYLSDFLFLVGYWKRLKKKMKITGVIQ